MLFIEIPVEGEKADLVNEHVKNENADRVNEHVHVQLYEVLLPRQTLSRGRTGGC